MTDVIHSNWNCVSIDCYNRIGYGQREIENRIKRKLVYKNAAQNHEYYNFFRGFVYFNTLLPYKMQIMTCILILALVFAVGCKLYSLSVFLICLTLYFSYCSDYECGWSIWLCLLYKMFQRMRSITECASKSHLLRRLHGYCDWKVMRSSICMSRDSVQHVDRACIISVAN